MIWNSIGGGALIGIAAAILILCNGKIAGVSGITSRLITLKSNGITWQIAFIAGLAIAPVIWRLFLPFPAVNVSASDSILVISGLLVGLGTRYGNGCTSGHGVCGISRLSFRSILATILFMSAGFAVVFIMRHALAA